KPVAQAAKGLPVSRDRTALGRRPCAPRPPKPRKRVTPANPPPLGESRCPDPQSRPSRTFEEEMGSPEPNPDSIIPGRRPLDPPRYPPCIESRGTALGSSSCSSLSVLSLS